MIKISIIPGADALFSEDTDDQGIEFPAQGLDRKREATLLTSAPGFQLQQSYSKTLVDIKATLVRRQAATTTMSDRQIVEWPPGISSKDIKGGGTSGLAALLPGTDQIIKFPHGESDDLERCATEVEVYERFEASALKRPPSILQYHGKTKYGIILEYAENGSLRSYLHRASPPQDELLLRWAQQAARALEFCHANGVLHGDINCSNFFLDCTLNLKLGDFAGSSIDQSHPSVFYSTTHQLPRTGDSLAITKRMEVFALGSSLYEMLTGCEPYAELAETEVTSLFRSKKFPDVTNLGTLGPVILECWNSDLNSMTEVLRLIDAQGQREPSRRTATASPHTTLATMFSFILVAYVFHSVRGSRSQF